MKNPLTGSGPLPLRLLLPSLLIAMLVGLGNRVRAQELAPNWLDPALALQSADGSLRHCLAVSLDRAWAVGDRGLILYTSNGGRRWEQQTSQVTCPLYSIAMESESAGWIVGGTIRSHSFSSAGVVLRTNDGGQHWEIQTATRLPRLLGMQAFGSGRLIAWGDYSPYYQTSVFESLDAGKTWNRGPCLVGHLQCAAFDGLGRGVLVTKVGDILQLEPSGQLSLLDLGLPNPSKIQVVRNGPSGWWLAGEEGLIVHSPDGQRWRKVALPGLPSDHALISIRDLAVHGRTLAVVGNPGSIVWQSPDLGQSWSVVPTEQTLPLHSVSMAGSERAIAVGPMARILGTRNGGQGWWTEHRQGDRLGMLNLAALPGSSAWALAAQSAWQYRRHAGILGMHAQYQESRADYLPDYDARLDILQSQLGLACFSALPMYPARSTAYNQSQQDQYPYTSVSSTKNSYGQGGVPIELERRLVLAIRTWRPDVLVIDSERDNQSLDARAARAIMDAIQWANQKGELFSRASGIVLHPWSEFSLLSAAPSQSDFSIALNQVLPGPGQKLDQLTRDVMGLELVPSDAQPTKFGYRWLDNRTGQGGKGELYSDGHPKSGSTRPVKLDAIGNFATVFKQREVEDRLIREAGSRWNRDERWKKGLLQYRQMLQDTEAPGALWDLAMRCREAGHWGRWQTCLEQIVLRDPNTGVAERALLELTAFHQSLELQHWLAKDRKRDLESEQVQLVSAAVRVENSVPATPFQGAEIGPEDPGPKMRPTPSKPAVEPDEQRWLRIQQAFLDKNHTFERDWRFQLLTIAGNRQRQDQPSNPQSSSPGLVALSKSPGLAGWCQLGEQEVRLEQSRNATVTLVPATDQRPYLDGHLQEECWSRALPVAMADPWGGRFPSASQVRFAFDAEYLYLGIQCPKWVPPARSSLSKKDRPSKTTGRSPDAARLNLDHIAVRLDLDRDYHTYYELILDSQGQVMDRCCGHAKWSPNWSVAHRDDDDSWCCEVAFPIDQLTPNTDVRGHTWGVHLHRTIPGMGSQTNSSIVSDRFLPQGARLIRFEGEPAGSSPLSGKKK